jgi:putative transcriptional regulator
VKTFVETTEFYKWQPRFLSGDAYAELQKELIANPRKGDVMPGCGGLRKLRIADPKRQKGKRGGARVIYLHIPEVGQFLMLDIYGKNEMDDLTPTEKRGLRELAREYKRLIVEAARKSEKEQEP